MALITSIPRANPSASFIGATTNHGTVQSAYLNFANTEVFSFGISKNSSSSITISKGGLYLIKAPIFFSSSSASYTLNIELDLNGSFQSLYTGSFSITSTVFFINTVVNIPEGATMRIRTRSSVTPSNHTNGNRLLNANSNGAFLIAKI